MILALSWLLIAILLAIWSIGVWVLHTLLVWSVGGIGVIDGQPRSLEALAMPESIAMWVPADLLIAIKSAATASLPILESALSFLPSIIGWLTPLSWGVWGIGTLCLLAMGAILHAVAFSMQRATKR